MKLGPGFQESEKFNSLARFKRIYSINIYSINGPVQYYNISFVWLCFPTQHHTTHSLPTAKEFNVCSCCMLLPVSDVGDFLCELVLWQETFYLLIFCYMKLLSNLDYNFDVNWLDTYHAAITIQHLCFHHINNK